MASIYTVGQVNNYIKRMFNQDFALNNIYIKGEVSNANITHRDIFILR